MEISRILLADDVYPDIAIMISAIILYDFISKSFYKKCPTVIAIGAFSAFIPMSLAFLSDSTVVGETSRSLNVG